jgi:hypothetical protein
LLYLFILKEELLRGRPGYEHLNDALHILIEAELPANVVDVRLRQAQEIIEELLKPVVCHPNSVEWIEIYSLFYFFVFYFLLRQMACSMSRFG